MAAMGDMVSNALLPYLDYEYLKSHPKSIVGHSDITALLLGGNLNTISGIILGKHRKFDDQGTAKIPADILLEVLSGKKIPVLADVDCCHTIPMVTLPIGGKVRLDAEKQETIFL